MPTMLLSVALLDEDEETLGRLSRLSVSDPVSPCLFGVETKDSAAGVLGVAPPPLLARTREDMAFFLALSLLGVTPLLLLVRELREGEGV